MATINEFFNKYNGKYIDFDKNGKYWCVDLMRTFLVEVLGLSGWNLPAVTYAKQIFTNFNTSNKNFTRIYNTPTGVPKKGDIIFWRYYFRVTGWAGHVAIFNSGNVNSLITFDQNYPTGFPSRFVKHSYRGIMGWLHPNI